MPTDRLARRLGLAGLLPFLATLILAWLGPPAWQGLGIRAFVIYAAVILAFLGGVHWGLALQEGGDDTKNCRHMVAGVLPSLVAWPAALIDTLLGVWLLLAGFVVLRAYEAAVIADLPAWYQRLRTWLTVGVVVCHLMLIARLLLLA